MKYQKIVVTFDGHQHKDIHEAKKHLDSLYTNILLKLARDMPEKYVDRAEHIDGNLPQFQELSRIKADMILQEEDEE